LSARPSQIGDGIGDEGLAHVLEGALGIGAGFD
jgi:hypothetical protein